MKFKNFFSNPFHFLNVKKSLAVLCFLFLFAQNSKAAAVKLNFNCLTNDLTTVSQFTAKAQLNIEEDNSVTGTIIYAIKEAGPDQVLSSETKIKVEGQATTYPAGSLANVDVISIAVHQTEDTTKGFLLLQGSKGQLGLSSQAIISGEQYKSACD